MTWLSQNKLNTVDAKVDTIDGIVDAILVDTTAIEVDTISIETKVDTLDTNVDALYDAASKVLLRTTSILPQGAPGQTAYFTVTGRVIITDVVGEVTTAIEGVAVSIKLIANPTVGADVDLCTALVINGDAVGTLYSITGTLGNPMVATTSGAVTAQALPIVIADGTIDLHTDINATGNAKWTLTYIPLDSGSTITVA